MYQSTRRLCSWTPRQQCHQGHGLFLESCLSVRFTPSKIGPFPTWGFSLTLVLNWRAWAIASEDHFGRSLRLIGSAQGAESVLGRELRESGAVDLIAWTLHASVPTSASQWEGDGRFGVATFWAQSWLNLDSLDLRQAPFAAAEVAAQSIGENKLIWDTSLSKPLTHFFAARLEKSGGGALVIKEVMASVKSIMPGESDKSKTKTV